MEENTQPVLAATKTMIPPERQAWVPRSRLLDELEGADEWGLILVRAPAGFGKSTLLAQLAHRFAGQPVAWLALDRQDNDPVLFWRYVCQALREAMPGVAESASDHINGQSPDITGMVVPALLNDLVNLEQPLLLLLDNYSIIDNPLVHSTVRLFLDHLPRPAHLVIATRSQPDFGLARLRAYGMVKEITATDLSFTADETANALQRLDGDSGDQSVAEIQARMEGWPVGVHVVGRSRAADPSKPVYSGPAKTGIRDFLMNEMLIQLDPSTMTFLRRISVLEEFTGELCDHVLDDVGSGTRLEELAVSNLLLIPLDETGTWFRFHQLLRDVLRSELETTEPDHKGELHLRAHEWMLKNGQESEAIHHAINAGELLTAAGLVCAFSWPYQYTGRGQTVARWIERLPESLLVEYPPLSVSASWSAALQGDIREAQRLCNIAASQSFDGPSPDGTASYESAVAILSGSLFPSGVDDALRQAKRAYELEPIDSPWRATAAVILGSSLGAAGEHESAVDVLAEATTERSDPGIRTFALGQLASFEVWRGNWAMAGEAADLAVQLIEQNGLAESTTSALAFATAAAIASHNGNPDLARNQQTRAETASIHAFPGLVLQVAVVNGETSLSLGDTDRAARYAASANQALSVMGDGGHLAVRLNSLVAETEGIAPEPSAGGAKLTTREQQILALLPSELSVREIGHQLYISRNTVKTHIARIFRKLDCGAREDAVTRARELGLLQAAPPPASDPMTSSLA